MAQNLRSLQNLQSLSIRYLQRASSCLPIGGPLARSACQAGWQAAEPVGPGALGRAAALGIRALTVSLRTEGNPASVRLAGASLAKGALGVEVAPLRRHGPP